MEQYINKDALVAEIKKRVKTNKECMLGLRNLDYYQGKVDALNDTISFLDTIEVKESEDERIRKYLIDVVNDYCKGSEHDGCIAWLEKQGKKTKPIEGFNTEFERQVSCLIASAMNKDYEYTKDFVKWTSEGLLNYAKHELDKQGEQKPCMIQWKGDNLKEVIDFTGKDKNFEKWFKSFEEYEKYVHVHNGIFKLFNTDGSHYEIPVGAWIVKTPDGYNVASKAALKQKPADKVEPKFKVGDTVIVKPMSCHGKVFKGEPFKIVDIIKDNYVSDDGKTYSISLQDGWELVEQNTAWSEEDELRMNTVCELLPGLDLQQNWLKSLKDRVGNFDDGYKVGFSAAKHNQWKPSDEQMVQLSKYCPDNMALTSLYEHLKKLKE